MPSAAEIAAREQRTPEQEAALRDDLLTPLEGGTIDEAWLGEALGAKGVFQRWAKPAGRAGMEGPYAMDRGSLERKHAVHGNPGILDTGQSLSAELRVSAGGVELGLYLKKISARRFAARKTPHDLRRDLASCSNECAFFEHISPALQAAGVRTPGVFYLGQRSFHAPEHDAEKMAESEYMLVLESMMGSGSQLCQHSPLARPEALHSLDLLARFHAWGWSPDAARAELMASQLHARASYWDLPRRGVAEMEKMPENWAAFLASFSSGHGEYATELLARPRVVALADRMLALGPWVSEQIHVSEKNERFRTIVHGDPKAMNIFVPLEAEKDPAAMAGPDGAALIDFQWTGKGLGMLDVAMHVSVLAPFSVLFLRRLNEVAVAQLYHSVELAAMEGGGEQELLRWYHQRLSAHLGPEDAAAYTAEVMLRHYNLCLLDYGRVVMGAFWKGASSETFAAKAARQNCAMVYRADACALRFAARLDEAAAALEAERGAGA